MGRTMHRAVERRIPGFTVVEMVLSLTISVLLIGSLMSIAVETSRFVRQTDADVSVRLEGDRAFSRLTDILRKSGRVADALGAFPLVVDGGTALEFRVLQDIDGNGYPFQESTGDLEWAPVVYRARLDADRNLVVEANGATVYTLGRHVHAVSFRTVNEDPTLHLDEIRVTFEVRKSTEQDVDIVHTVRGSILMRN